MFEKYEDILDRLSNDEFWDRYRRCSQELVGVRTVDEVIEICGKHFGRSSEDAFFPGGSGDTEILTLLLDAGWRPVWISAAYYFAIKEPGDGVTPGLTYIEGDIARGIRRKY